MIDLLLEPFGYAYMTRAIWVCGLVGLVCGLLSCFLVLKGWSLMGDALSHAVVPGVALAYLAGLPFALGAFSAGLAAALGIVAVRRLTMLKEDAAIGVVFTGLFALGLVIVSLNPVSVSLRSIVFGNALAVGDGDAAQVAAISALALAAVAVLWKDLLLAFFDETHARTVGLDPWRLRLIFFALLSAAVVAALQAVGAVLVIALVVTPGATAYLLTDRFGVMLAIAGSVGGATAALGAYLSFFLDGAVGGLIVCLQTLLFLAAFLFAPKHGRLAARRATRERAA